MEAGEVQRSDEQDISDLSKSSLLPTFPHKFHCLELAALAEACLDRKGKGSFAVVYQAFVQRVLKKRRDH